MGRCVQLVMGPAGSGKSTYCAAVARHLADSRRVVTMVNLDPAAQDLPFEAHVDVRTLVALDDVTAPDAGTGRVGFGPNGGLVFCLEYLADHLEWLRDELNEADPSDDAYVVVDCPGQIELYTHVPAMRDVVTALKSWGFHVAGVFLVDGAMVAGDASKYLSGLLLATAAMVQLEVPWINVLTKVDLISARGARARVRGSREGAPAAAQAGGAAASVAWGHGDDDEDERDADEEDERLGTFESRLCEVDFEWVRDQLAATARARPASESTLDRRWNRLNKALCNLVEDFAMVRFLPLDAFDAESVEFVLSHVDNVLQYGEDLEPVEPREEEEGEQG